MGNYARSVKWVLVPVFGFAVAVTVLRLQYYKGNSERNQLKSYIREQGIEALYLRSVDDGLIEFNIKAEDYLSDVFKARKAIEEYGRTEAGHTFTVIEFSSGLPDYVRLRSSGPPSWSLDNMEYQFEKLDISRLREAGDLRKLELRGKIEFDDMNVLDGCSSLEYLSIKQYDDKKIPEDFIAHLIETHPGCTIIADGEEVATAPAAENDK